MRSKKLKVLITWFSTSLGGAERSVVDLCNYLSRKEKLSLVLLYISSYQNKANDPINTINKNIKIYKMRMNLRLYEIVSFFILFYISLKEKPDLVHLNFRAVRQESLVAKIFGIPTISTIRAIFLDRNDAKDFESVDVAVGVSKAAIKKIIKLGYRGKTRVIYNGIDINQINLFFNSRIDKNKIYFMSRLVGWKRPDWFILAAVRLHKKLKNANFYIFGEGPEEEKLKRLIKAHKADSYIHLLGFVGLNDKKLKNMGIFVLPSFAEPFGKSLIEAVMRGKVVVATNFGAIPELIPNEDLLFERDDLSSLVDKIFMVYNKFDIYKRYFKKLSRIFLKKYNMERVAEEYYRLYQSI